MESLLFTIIAQGILVGLLCSYVAGQKNRSKGNWFILGFCFSLLALIALAAIPTLSKEVELSYAPQPQTMQSLAQELNKPDAGNYFPGNRDLSNDEYKIWLVAKYKITKNDALGLVCRNKIFQTIELALAHADECYTVELNAINPEENTLNASSEGAKLAQKFGITYNDERYIWDGNHFKALSSAIAYAQKHAPSQLVDRSRIIAESAQVNTPSTQEIADKLKHHDIRFQEDRYVWQGNFFKKATDAIAYAERNNST